MNDKSNKNIFWLCEKMIVNLIYILIRIENYAEIDLTFCNAQDVNENRTNLK
jgi:hypothetical protein